MAAALFSKPSRQPRFTIILAIFRTQRQAKSIIFKPLIEAG